MPTGIEEAVIVETLIKESAEAAVKEVTEASMKEISEEVVSRGIDEYTRERQLMEDTVNNSERIRMRTVALKSQYSDAGPGQLEELQERLYSNERTLKGFVGEDSIKQWGESKNALVERAGKFNETIGDNKITPSRNLAYEQLTLSQEGKPIMKRGLLEAGKTYSIESKNGTIDKYLASEVKQGHLIKQIMEASQATNEKAIVAVPKNFTEYASVNPAHAAELIKIIEEVNGVVAPLIPSTETQVECLQQIIIGG